MRPPESCGHASPHTSKGKIQIVFFTAFLLNKLFLPVTNPYVAIEGVKLKLRPAVGHAHAEELIALVDEFSIALLAHAGAARQCRDIEIAVRVAVEGLHPQIRRKTRPEGDIHVAIERSEIARSRRIPAEQHLYRTVERVRVPRA